MRCPACDRDNPEDASFCAGCGGSLARELVCPDCGRPNPLDANFCLGCGRRLSESAALASSATPVGAQHAAPLRQSGSEIPSSFANGRYQVKRFLGEGGKKKVYLARDTLLDRDVAFALIKTEGLDETGRQRITREAQSMGRLGDHPCIMPIYDVGEENPRPGPLPEGEGIRGAVGEAFRPPASQPFMVLPLMPGGDVEGLIEKAAEHRLPLERVVEIGIEVCQGLEFAHAKGIVHRDLKPGNVWLTADGHAKIGDFGLAVALDKSRLTQAGMMVGTVNYMPPEQAMGGEVGPRSDLYSLGCMLYEMVCGRPPFIGDETVAIIGQHLNTPPVAPSWHRPDCPPGLEALVLRLLEKDPGKRPGSASEVRDALGTLTLTLSQGARGTETSEPSPSGRGQGEGSDPLYRRTFVGREAELRQLHASFDAALSGRGSLAMVVGEPGIGKTSVCEQLATYAALRGGKHLIGHCYEEGSLSLPYLPFVEAMRSYVLAREPDDLRKELGTGASEVARIVSEVRDKVQVSPSDGGDPEEQRWRLLQAVTGFLRNASMVQPLLLVLEDLHDADRGTLDLLLHLSRNLEGARLLIVGTYRDVEVDRAHPLSAAVAELRRAGSFLRVPLRGLTVDEVHRMYEAIRGQSVAWAQAELVHRQTEGNPLFVQEVLRYLVEEGIVYREGGRYNIKPEDQANEANIPEGLRDVVGRRLNRLSEKSNQVLSIAAVIGREFRLDVLQKVAGLPEDELYAGVEEAQERAIIEQRQMVGSLGFRFTHAFFRQTLYEEMFAPRRIRWHQQVGHALEEVHVRRLEEHASELAEHFAQSTEAQDLEKALRYCQLAADRAMKVFAYSEAVRHLEQALRTLEILDADDQLRRCDLLLALGQALMPAGQTVRAATEVAEEAFAIAADLKEPERTTDACRIALDALYRYAGVEVRLMPEWKSWADRADRHTEPGTLARVYAELALAVLKIGFDEDLLSTFSRVLDEARKVADNQALFQCAAVAMLGGAPLLPVWKTGLGLAEEFSVRPRDGVAISTLVQVLSHCASFFLAWGERDRAEEMWNEIRDLAERSKDGYVLLRPVTNEITIRTLDGELEAALDAADRLVVSGQESGSAVLSERAAALQGLRPRLYLGRAHEALMGKEPGSNAVSNSARRALVMAYSQRRRDAQSVLDQEMPAARIGLVMAHLQRHNDAQSIVDQEMQRASTAVAMWNASNTVALLETAVELADREATGKLMDELQPMSHLICSRGQELTAFGRHVGAAARLLGRTDDARAFYTQALEVCEKVRFRPEVALTRLELAELLLDHYPDERAQAIEHLDFAIGEFREMKMQPSLERALRHRGLLKA